MSQLQEPLAAADHATLAASYLPASSRAAHELNAVRVEIEDRILNTIPTTESDLRLMIGAIRDAVQQEGPALVRQAELALTAAEGDLGTAMALGDVVLESDCGPWAIGLASSLDVAYCRLAGLH